MWLQHWVNRLSRLAGCLDGGQQQRDQDADDRDNDQDFTNAKPTVLRGRLSPLPRLMVAAFSVNTLSTSYNAGT